MLLPSSRRVTLPPRTALRVAGAAGSAWIVQASHQWHQGVHGPDAGRFRFAALRVRCHGHEFNNFHFTISNHLRTHSTHC